MTNQEKQEYTQAVEFIKFYVEATEKIHEDHPMLRSQLLHACNLLEKNAYYQP
jgi:hypothetical protein